MNPSNSLNEKPEKVPLEVLDAKNQTSKNDTPKAAVGAAGITTPLVAPSAASAGASANTAGNWSSDINQEVVAQTAQTTINSINDLISNQSTPNPSIKLEDEQSSQIQADDVTPAELIPTTEAETPNEIELLNTHEQLK